METPGGWPPDAVPSTDQVVADERRRIVAGAWRVLARSGFEGFKVQLVLREAHLSARSFYRHFDGKDELLLTLLIDEMRRSGVRLTAAVDAESEPAAQVEAWMSAVLRITDDPRLAPRARLFSDQPAVMHRFATQVAESTRHLLIPLEGAIQRGREAGLFPLAEPVRDALFVYMLTGSMQTRILDHPDEAPLEDVITEAVRFVLRALSSPAEPTRGGTAPRTLPG